LLIDGEIADGSVIEVDVANGELRIAARAAAPAAS
jgi:hypothetical protein